MLFTARCIQKPSCNAFRYRLYLVRELQFSVSSDQAFLGGTLGLEAVTMHQACLRGPWAFYEKRSQEQEAKINQLQQQVGKGVEAMFASIKSWGPGVKLLSATCSSSEDHGYSWSALWWPWNRGLLVGNSSSTHFHAGVHVARSVDIGSRSLRSPVNSFKCCLLLCKLKNMILQRRTFSLMTSQQKYLQKPKATSPWVLKRKWMRKHLIKQQLSWGSRLGSCQRRTMS